MASWKKYSEAKRLLAEIRTLQTKPLTAAQRNRLEVLYAELAGILTHPWLPVPWPDRLIMMGIVVIGMQQAAVGNYEPMIFWLLLPLFSPRIVWECAYFWSRATRWLHGALQN